MCVCGCVWVCVCACVYERDSWRELGRERVRDRNSQFSRETDYKCCETQKERKGEGEGEDWGWGGRTLLFVVTLPLGPSLINPTLLCPATLGNLYGSQRQVPGTSREGFQERSLRESLTGLPLRLNQLGLASLPNFWGRGQRWHRMGVRPS